jgi:tetratricopeptide (TPR) repeat protein
MTRLALFGIPLVFFVSTVQAQQVPNGPLGTSPADNAATPAFAKMTPREKAEMNAAILMARKDFETAAKTYQTILIDDPHNARILNLTGIAYQKMGEGEKAGHYYKLALRYDKNNSDALNNLGAVEAGEARYGKAIKYYKQSIAKGKAVGTVYANLGSAYCAIKQNSKGLEAFAKALALDPEVFEHRGDSGTIVQPRSSPDPASLHFTMAKSYAKIGDAERAARYLKMARDEGYKDFRAAEKDPDFAKVIKDPRVQEVLLVQPAYAAQPPKPATN